MVLSKELHTYLQETITASERVIDHLQKLIDMCMACNHEACAQSVGEAVKTSVECINACKATVTEVTKHLETANNDECAVQLEEFIQKSHELTMTLEELIQECRGGKKECTESALAAIELCTELAESANECLNT